MDEYQDIASLRGRLGRDRAAGRTIGLVPTMGYLHAGHLSLVDLVRRVSDVVVMSSFVNPLQFGAGEDFGRYPRDPVGDFRLAADRGVDALFRPAAAEMYEAGSDLRIGAGEVGSRLEGAVRPGHFDGVLTVVAKLFNIVQPHAAAFGQKDIQQVVLIRRMVRELNFPVEIVVAPIQREADGLAMSSRNVYLSASDRQEALRLSRAVNAADAAWRSGERNGPALISTTDRVLRAGTGVQVDYAAVVDPEELLPVDDAVPGTIVAVAARVGTTRLIDNVILGASNG